MAEVSEQESQQQPDSQAEQEAADVSQPEVSESAQEQPLPAVDEPESQEEPPAQEEPSQLSELSTIIDFLSRLRSTCSRIRESLDLLDRNASQILLQEYASVLAYIPKALQMLHDYRRFAPDFDKRVEALHKGLRSARKDDSALSSEEERVIAVCASIRETVLASVGGLEYALAHVRSTTSDLLSLIVYDDDDFIGFADDRLRVINIALVEGVAYEEENRIRSLKRDVLELRSLEDHLAELKPQS